MRTTVITDAPAHLVRIAEGIFIYRWILFDIDILGDICAILLTVALALLQHLFRNIEINKIFKEMLKLSQSASIV